MRSPGVTAAVFPTKPERGIYNIVEQPMWREYQEFLVRLGVPAGLLPDVDGSSFDISVARLAGQDVATALSIDHHGDRGIYNVSTLSSARRRGIGTALTARHLHRAKRRGCATASLQSTTMAEGVCASLGFEDLGRILELGPGRGGP